MAARVGVHAPPARPLPAPAPRGAGSRDHGPGRVRRRGRMSGAAALCRRIPPGYSDFGRQVMKIAIRDIKAAPQHLSYVEEVEELNQRLGRGVRDFQVGQGMAVDVEYYRAGLDLFFEGTVRGEVVGSCARCLEGYPFSLDRRFALVLTPRVAAGIAKGELSSEELDLGTYTGEEVDLT